MRRMDLPWETWLAIVAFLQGTGAPMPGSTRRIQQALDHTPVHRHLLRMTISDDVFARSITLACVGRGMPFPAAS